MQKLPQRIYAATDNTTMMWNTVDRKLHKEFSFPDFATALAFVNEVGAIAERMNHHPDIHLFWGKVVIELFTHDKNAITQQDRDLATQIDKIYPR
jgi:4a-hydroxytetrahydrobiopterin dehydratase